jgi:uncharacterized membrane protein YciS (DUF1049 family)
VRWIRLLVAIGVVAVGLAFGALNADELLVSFYLAEFRLSTGTALLAAALLGAVAAGLCLWLTVIWPLQRRLKRSQRAAQQTPGSALEPVEQDHLAQDRA